MRAQLVGVTKHHGGQVVLDGASLAVGPRARIGLVGPNGVGKSTVLRLLAGEEAPDGGAVVLDPPDLTVAHMPQEHDARPGETLLERLARRTGIAAAERELEAAAATLADGDDAGVAAGRYDRALSRFLALGGGDLESRAAKLCSALRLGVDLGRPLDGLSGGEAGRASLAAALLARADLLLLDEPTNDLDADGLERLEAFVASYPGAVVLVSHDRAFLDASVDRVAEIDPRSRRIVEWSGGWSEYAERRDAARAAAYDTLARAQERRRELTTLLSHRRTEARAGGAAADRRGTHALMTKVRQAERLLERNPLPEKPFEPWELRLELRASGRVSAPAARLDGAVVERGTTTVGPLRSRGAARRAGRGDRTERIRQDDAPPGAARRAGAHVGDEGSRARRRPGRDHPGASLVHVRRAAPRGVRPCDGADPGRRTDAAREVRARRGPRLAFVRDALARASAPGRTSRSCRPRA